MLKPWYRGRRLCSFVLVLVICLALAMSTARSSAARAHAATSMPASGQPVTTISATLIASSLLRPTYMAAAPYDRTRLFVTEQAGRIRLVRNGSLLTTPFLDIQSLVLSSGFEEGLLSMAFHPHYATNGYFYVCFTNTGGNVEVDRYTVSANPDQANPASRFVVIIINHPNSVYHHGGQLQFGPEGYLYLSTGDGNDPGDQLNNAQNTGVLLGKMLRVDVDGGSPYAIPPTNPFVGPGNPLDQIWSIGFRNPWRFSFDRLTGDMWLGDVGQYLWEEVNHEPPDSGGRNYAWNCYEGTHPYGTNPSLPHCLGRTFTWPAYEYGHTTGRCAVSGGYVYRGSPNSAFFGQYVFSDYCQVNGLLTLSPDGSSWVVASHTLVPPAGHSVDNPSAFGQDAMGDLYLVDFSYTAGELYRLDLRPGSCVAGNEDVNGDGQVDVVDIQLVAADFLRSDFVPDYDVDCSGTVDLVDVQQVAAAWAA